MNLNSSKTYSLVHIWQCEYHSKYFDIGHCDSLKTVFRESHIRSDAPSVLISLWTVRPNFSKTLYTTLKQPYSIRSLKPLVCFLKRTFKPPPTAGSNSCEPLAVTNHRKHHTQHIWHHYLPTSQSPEIQRWLFYSWSFEHVYLNCPSWDRHGSHQIFYSPKIPLSAPVLSDMPGKWLLFEGSVLVLYHTEFFLAQFFLAQFFLTPSFFDSVFF